MLGRVPLAEAIRAEKDPQIKALLAEVSQIKRCGERHLGLKPSQNYQTYYSTPLPGVTFVVTAAYPDRLERYQWGYPLLGKLPYRGYFDPDAARAYAKDLEAEGLDVWIFPSTAYSTLGWLNDPITTPMLRAGRYGLAESLLHEMAHQTYFVQGQGDFNEQLASFVGAQGAKLYLTQAEGVLELAAAQAKKVKADQLKEDLKVLRGQLEALFAQPLPKKEILRRKQQLYQAFAQSQREQTPKAPARQWEFNNARLLLYELYEEKNPLFIQLWQQARGDWALFWRFVKEDAKKRFHSG